jgi:hypothetical protein
MNRLSLLTAFSALGLIIAATPADALQDQAPSAVFLIADQGAQSQSGAGNRPTAGGGEGEDTAAQGDGPRALPPSGAPGFKHDDGSSPRSNDGGNRQSKDNSKAGAANPTSPRSPMNRGR